jgi:PAS domain S-box-containing protein
MAENSAEYWKKKYLETIEKSNVIIKQANISSKLRVKKYNDLLEKYQELEHSHHNLQMMFDIFDKYVITSMTDLSGKITEVSQAFVDISGFTKKELIGRSHNIVRHPDMHPTLFEHLWQTITQKKVWKGLIKNQKKDGSAYWVETTIIPLIDENAKHFGYKAIRIDITSDMEINDNITGLLGDEDREKFYL